jgi:predicted metal-dependent HD superfamily phosphohydrolase
MEQEFLESLKNYTSDSALQLTLWEEVEKNYSKSSRHYHNLAHLNSLLSELQMHQDKFDHWDTIIFAIAYHDIVYNTLKSNNEERSAAIARKRLSTISFPDKQATLCGELILATKKHEPRDFQTNLFTDADLSILGSDPDTYQAYSKKIRKEYALYPDMVYNPGRKKVLLHFLDMPKIFKTKEFSAQYEQAAKINIETELRSLTNRTI